MDKDTPGSSNSIIRRIVITGAECTGKSTLTQALSGYYGEPWSSEFVRHYVNRLNRALCLDDLESIARGQLAQEDAGIHNAKRFILHDTNLLSSIIYANYYFGTVIDWLNDTFLSRNYTLYLLCLPDFPWIPDEGQRDSPDAQRHLHRQFKASLVELQLPHIEIGGSESERFSKAIKAIDEVL